MFKSVNIEASYLSVSAPTTEDEGHTLVEKASTSDHVTSAMLALVSRDYGMFNRDEAPQYFSAPAIKENRT